MLDDVTITLPREGLLELAHAINEGALGNRFAFLRSRVPHDPEHASTLESADIALQAAASIICKRAG